MDPYNNLTKILQKRHISFVKIPHYENCRHVLNLPDEQRCEFVRNTESCREMAFKIDCTEFVFCTLNFSQAEWVGILILLLIAIFIIYVINLFITKFFVSTTLSIGKMLNWSEYLTGVVVITLSNTLYNFYFAFYKISQDIDLLYNSVMGTDLIMIGILIPIIIIIRPFKIIKYYLIIDAVYLMIGYIIIDYYFKAQEIGYIHSIILALGYIIYIVILWVDSRLLAWQITYQDVEPLRMAELMYAKEPFKIFSNMENKLDITSDEDTTMVAIRKYADFFTVGEKLSANAHLFKQFKDDILYVNRDQVGSVRRFKRTMDIPFVIIFRLVMPVIDYRKPCHQWSKLLRTINVVTFPLACMYALSVEEIIYYLYVLIVCIILAFVVFITSRTDRAPQYHGLYAICVFFGYTFITFGMMSEVENIISTLFMLFNFDKETIGHLALALFDVIPDFSLSINLVMKGYPKMAWAGVFASIIFRGYFELGIRFFLRELYEDRTYITSGQMGPTCGIFAMLQILFTFIGFKHVDYFGRPAVGYFLILTYLIFLLFTILVDAELLHGFATDHINQLFMFESKEIM